jgi:hypothetical protein
MVFEIDNRCQFYYFVIFTDSKIVCLSVANPNYGCGCTIRHTKQFGDFPLLNNLNAKLLIKDSEI